METNKMSDEGLLLHFIDKAFEMLWLSSKEEYLNAKRDGGCTYRNSDMIEKSTISIAKSMFNSYKKLQAEMFGSK